jgi:hypothetical protein
MGLYLLIVFVKVLFLYNIRMDGDYVMMPGNRNGHLVLVDLNSWMYYHRNGYRYFSKRNLNYLAIKFLLKLY